MSDVYFILDLKSNIVSLGQETKSGCDVRLRDAYLTMHDRNGKLLVRAVRTKNRYTKYVWESRNQCFCFQKNKRFKSMACKVGT